MIPAPPFAPVAGDAMPLVHWPAEGGADRAASHVLDERETWTDFSVPDANAAAATDRWVSHLSVEGMHCATCGFAVERALAAVPGVVSAQVNAASRVARVVWSAAQTRPSRWCAAAQSAGYALVPVLGVHDSLARAAEGRRLLWRWLVAGFCMMQVMMYAFPAYVAGPGDISAEAAQLLRWASWVLTLPVMLFSATPMFASAWRDLRHGQIGMDVPVALGIAIAFAASTAATFDPSGPWGAEVWYDSVTMFVFFLLSGRLLEQRLRHRTAGALEALARRLPPSVERRLPDGRFESVGLHRLRSGDVVRVLPGMAFPADGRVLQGRTQVDEALLTGESRALARAEGEPVIAGSHNLSAAVLMQVEKTGAATRYASIVALMQAAAAQKPRMAELADRVAKPFLAAVVAASLGAALWWWPESPAHALGVAIAVLIVTCPCALSLATPTATLASAGALARAGIHVRRLQALTGLTAVDTVVFDKTGTLTLDTLGVRVMATRHGADAATALRLAAALAAHSLHPVSRALVRAAKVARPDGGDDAAQVLQVADVAEVAGQGLRGSVRHQGVVRHLRLGNATLCGEVPSAGELGGSHVHLADAAGWLASFALEETLRPDAAAAVAALRAQGLAVHVLSGDSPAAVARVAERVGITSLHANQSPQDKLAFMAGLQQAGHGVVMVGDGINDAPVMARADVSFTVGQAAPLTQSRADVVVLGGQLMAVAAVLQRARRTRRVTAQNLAWAAAYNAVCVPLALMGWMPAWLAGAGMAASSLAVVLNAARLSGAGSLEARMAAKALEA